MNCSCLGRAACTKDGDNVSISKEHSYRHVVCAQESQPCCTRRLSLCECGPARERENQEKERSELLDLMEESPGFKCCSMCKTFCFQTHGEFGRNETDVLFSAPTFFCLIRRSQITGSELLRIPAPILENSNVYIEEKVRLKGRSGFECEVRVQQDGHDYAFDTSDTGFVSFIKHHTIKVADALVFHLIAESSFRVTVYDEYGEEKKIASVSKTPHRSDSKHTSRSKKSRHDDTKDSDGGRSDERGADNTPNLRRKKLSKKVEVRSKKNPRSNQQGPSFDRPAASLVQQENRVDVSPVKRNSDAAGVGDMEQLVSSREPRSARKRKSSDAYHGEESEVEHFLKRREFERKEAAKRQLDAANALIQRLNQPSQLVVINHSHIDQGRVYLSKIPVPKVSTYLTLKSNAADEEIGDHYNVKWSVAPGGLRGRLSSGWKQIVEDHKLNIDDICVFEATDNEFVFEVHIFHLSTNVTAQNQLQAHNHSNDLRPEQSMTEEVDGLGSQEEVRASAGL